MKSRRIVCLAFCLLVFAASSFLISVRAEPITFTLDSSKSFAYLTGDVDGHPFLQQGSGSTNTSYSGTIEADLTYPNITFVGGSLMAGANSGTWQPALGGGSGSALANYGIQVPDYYSIKAALRNGLLDVTSAGSTITAGAFPASDVSFKFPTSATVMDYRYTYVIIFTFSDGGTESLTGTYPNASVANATLVTVGDELVLTIPVDISGTAVSSTPIGNITTHYRLRGKLVAKAPVPEAPGPLSWVGDSVTTNGWRDPLNWSPAYRPREWNQITFGDGGATNGAGLVNNTVNANTLVNTLSYTALADNFHTTKIPANTSLTITGGVAGAALFVGSNTDAGGDATNYITFLGNGTLAITNPLGTVNIRQDSASGGLHRSTLNLSGLDKFNCSVNSIIVGGVASINRPNGTLMLAKTNIVSLTATSAFSVTVGDGSVGGNGGNGVMLLGQTNVFLNDGGMALGYIKSSGTMSFDSGLANPSVRFRSLDGTNRQSIWYLGYNNTSGSGSTCTGTLDLSGGNVDAMVTTIYVGRGQSYAVNSTAFGVGNLTIDKGVIDTDDMEIGARRSNYGGPARGTVTVSGTAQLIVNDTFRFGFDRTIVASNAPCSGTLNINSGGFVWARSDILDGGFGTNVININGGHLKVAGQLGHLSSTTDRPFDQFNLTNATLSLALASTITAANPICSVTNLNLATALTLNLSGGGFTLGQYPLIKYYSGSIGGNGFGVATLGAQPARTRGYLSNNIANRSIDYVVTNIYAIKWLGNVNTNWNINTTTNWRDTLTSAATTYLEDFVPGDSVIFDDTATGTTTVNLTTNLSPTQINITNATKTYVFNGAGKITGSTGLNKNGTGIAVLTNSGINDFTGAVNINAGTLRLGLTGDQLPTNANLTIAAVSGALLDLNGTNQTVNTLNGGGNGGNVALGAGALTTTASGTFNGVISGTGKFRKVGSGTQTLGGANIYSGGTYIAGTVTLINPSGSGLGSGPVEIASGILNVGNGGAAGLNAVTVITNNGVLVFNATNNTFFSAIHGNGSVTKNNTNTVTIISAGTYTGATSINEGALRISHSTALGSATVGTTIAGGTTVARLEAQGGLIVAEPLTLTMKSSSLGAAPHVVNVSGNNTFTGTITCNTGGSYWTFRSDADTLNVSGPVAISASATGSRYLRLTGAAEGDWATDFPSGPAGAFTRIWKDGAGTWTLSAVNNYTDNTYVDNGRLVVNGEIRSLATVFVGDATLAVQGTLGGTGIIRSTVTVNTNGILAPGNSVGTLTITTNLILLTGGNAVFEVNSDTLAHDLITGMNNVTYGGTLTISLLGGGTAITNGASFQLFSAASYGGAFDAIVPATPGPGLAWDTSQLTVNGILGVKLPVNTTPTSLTFALTGNQLNISWPPDHTGWRLEGQTNGIDVGLSNNWFTVSGSAATNQVFMPVDSVNGTVFYRLVYP